MFPQKSLLIASFRMRYRLPEIIVLQSALNLLGTMLSDNKQLAGELHVERLLVFCLVWSFGAFFERLLDRKNFDQMLKSLSNW